VAAKAGDIRTIREFEDALCDVLGCSRAPRQVDCAARLQGDKRTVIAARQRHRIAARRSQANFGVLLRVRVCRQLRTLPGDQFFPRWADAVEKVENRTTPKILQMVIIQLLRRCDALYCADTKSVVIFLRHDVVPHVGAARNASVRPRRPSQRVDRLTLAAHACYKIEVLPIQSHPDDAGLIGASHLAPSWIFEAHDSILAVDIGGTNIRCGSLRAGNTRRKFWQCRIAVRIAGKA
jgi:hypothetical protein